MRKAAVFLIVPAVCIALFVAMYHVSVQQARDDYYDNMPTGTVVELVGQYAERHRELAKLAAEVREAQARVHQAAGLISDALKNSEQEAEKSKKLLEQAFAESVNRAEPLFKAAREAKNRSEQAKASIPALQKAAQPAVDALREALDRYYQARNSQDAARHDYHVIACGGTRRIVKLDPALVMKAEKEWVDTLRPEASGDEILATAVQRYDEAWSRLSTIVAECLKHKGERSRASKELHEASEAFEKLRGRVMEDDTPEIQHEAQVAHSRLLSARGADKLPWTRTSSDRRNTGPLKSITTKPFPR